MTIVPNKGYRANPDRAVYVLGIIDQAMVDRLTPEIVSLTTKSRDPITVYIDSFGGTVFYKDAITRLLRAPNQDGAAPCRVVTVVTNRAASAAADLLSWGQYAIAYPGARVLYHGVRRPMQDPITVELGSTLTQELRVSNDRFAMALARDAEERFVLRYIATSNLRDDYKKGHPTASDLECFVGLTRPNLSGAAREILDRTLSRYRRYFQLLEQATKVFQRVAKTPKKRHAQLEAQILAKLISLELMEHKKDPDWTFADGGLLNLLDDFNLFNEHIQNYRSKQFRRICDRWAGYVLTEQQHAELAKIPDEKQKSDAQFEIVSPTFEEAWSFFVALCHVLQEGENELSAKDALLLGLVDEVIGETSVPIIRLFVEMPPDPPAGEKPQQPAVQENATAIPGPPPPASPQEGAAAPSSGVAPSETAKS